MKQNEKSNGSLHERWTECWAERLAGRIAGAASAEEMRMWPLMLRTLALNLRAGIPLQEAVHTDPGSRQLGQLGEFGQFGQGELVPGTGKTRTKNSSRKSARPRRARGFLSEDYGHKRCAEDIRRFTQALATVTSWGAPAHLACAQLLENSTRMRPHSRERLHDLQLSLRMSESAGAPLATSLERAAEHAEERIDALLGRQSALAAPRATGRILSWLPLLGLGLGVLMGSDPVGVLTGSVLGALTGLLGLGLAFAGRRWTAALVHRAEVESAASNGAEQTSNMPPVDTALVLELLAAQLRAGLAPLAALGTLAEGCTLDECGATCRSLGEHAPGCTEYVPAEGHEKALEDYAPAGDPEEGASTAEYGIVMLAAVGFAGLLVLILKSDEVRSMLLDIVRNALSIAGNTGLL